MTLVRSSRDPLPLMVAAFTLLAVNTLCAGGTGSVLSRFGVGEIRHFPGERSAGMGGASIGLRGSASAGVLNPASWTDLSRTRFSVGAIYEGYASNDGVHSSFLSGAGFNGFTFALPVSASDGVVIGAGLVPYSRVGFTVTSQVVEGTYAYRLDQLGEGGLSSAYIGVSGIVGRDWHLGLKFSYLFGTLTHTTRQIFNSSQLTDGAVSRNLRMDGANVTFGLIYSGLGTAFGFSEARSLDLGLVFTTKTRMPTIQENFYEYSVGSTVVGRDTTTVEEGISSLPLALGAGVSYTVKDNYVVAADLYYQNWNAFDLFGMHPPELRNSYRFAIGGEIFPKREPSAGFFEKTAYRVGLFYQSTSLRIAGSGINEFGVTGGLGLPMFGDTRFTLGVEYSIRGTTQTLRDNILRVSLTLSAAELWFIRPPDE